MLIINFLFLGLIFTVPILLLIHLKRGKKKKVFLRYSLIGFILLAILIFVFAWWTDKSDIILLSHYGYNFDAMTDLDRYKNVTIENLEKVKFIEVSVMGLGWPLKAIFAEVLVIPYLFIVYLLFYVISKIKK